MQANTSPALTRGEAEDFLFLEASLLDAGNATEWLTLLSDDIDYRIPIRITRDTTPGPPQFSDNSFHMQEDRASLTARVKRLESRSAWSEIPPTRTRRFVANVRVLSASAPRYEVESNILLLRALADSPTDVLSGQRKDTVIREGGSLKLQKRLVLLDHTFLPMENLAVFL